MKSDGGRDAKEVFDWMGPQSAHFQLDSVDLPSCSRTTSGGSYMVSETTKNKKKTKQNSFLKTSTELVLTTCQTSWACCVHSSKIF